mmetsp:Transcript_95657/g.274661  ORF Transcript_95657/g.274661 Transcript_95657/m.274661 type:complete len:204 (+) Transcript_95657:593-1204(+)
MHFAAVRFFRICTLVHNTNSINFRFVKSVLEQKFICEVTDTFLPTTDCCRCNRVAKSILLTLTILFMSSRNLAQHIVTNHKRRWSEGHGSPVPATISFKWLDRQTRDCSPCCIFRARAEAHCDWAPSRIELLLLLACCARSARHEELFWSLLRLVSGRKWLRASDEALNLTLLWSGGGTLDSAFKQERSKGGISSVSILRTIL